ncbi:type IV pilus biogenesis/stability protein PilW [Stenotrophobium rhamnosiphilum]|uniref:type IV pilus biogenesis/stability protein PilW n=1 Tax=Stenotrophobium rhamnosiphilum TaxID=2029166 RepID=UPI001374D80A|nr:type IV pilus biogenesis/stability protein PilW [Stenotrophobium rhamnosiphilum]
MKIRFVALLLVTLLAACASDADLPKGVSAKDAARINLQLGADYARKNEFDVAIEKLKRAIKQDPDLAQAYSTLAYVYGAKGMKEAAEKNYRKAIALDDNDGNLRNNFGVFLCANGKESEALRYFVQAVASKNYTTPEVAWTNAGVCVRRKPDLEAAERYFREALQVKPQFRDALGQMATLTYEKKDYLRCRAFLQRYLATGQATPEVLWIASLNERQLGDISTAQDYESRLKREFPESEQAANLKPNKQ